MTFSFHRALQGAAAACGVISISWSLGSSTARAQTLPIAGNPAEAVAQDRDARDAIEQADRGAIRGVREQDQAALRTANRLNRDVRQEARQELSQTVGQNATVNRDTSLRPGIDGSLRDMN